MINKAKFIQVVNINYLKFIMSLNPKCKNVFFRKAFIPPPLAEEKIIIQTYDTKLIDFIANKSPLLASNAGFIRFYNNIDLYGLDLCVDLTTKLLKSIPNIGFIFALADDKKEIEYIKKIKEKIEELNIKNNFYLMTGQKEFWPILKKVDLFLRTTYIDGAPLSIEEARYFNCPVLASNAAPRPTSTIIFRNRDLDDLYLKCYNFLVNKFGL